MRSAQLLFATTLVILTPNVARTAFAAQHEQHAHTETREGALRLDVDGSKNPDLVSDYHAYRQFIVAASIPDKASATERRHRQTYIKRIGLSAADQALLKAALRNVPERIEIVAARRKSLGTAMSSSMRVVLREQEEKVFDGANQRIRMLLSKGGWRRLDAFVQRQKRHIKVYTNESR